MKDDEIINKFNLFTSPEKGRSIGSIAVSEGNIYSTDGRMAFVGKLNGPHVDVIPERYPLKSIQGILSGPRATTKWFAINLTEFEILDGIFNEVFRSAMVDHDRGYRNRYTEEICPCCNETVYWDSWDGVLVKEKENTPRLDLREVTISTRIIFGKGESVLVNFCYLHQVVHAFGGSVRFAIGHCTDENNPMLYMKTIDDRFYGVLMPLRSYGGDYQANCVLNAFMEAEHVRTQA